jgi:hypothetical protein
LVEAQTTQWPKEKGQTTIYKTLHKQLNIDQKPGMNSGVPEE